MTSLAERLDGIDAQLNVLARKHGVPGASLAVLHGGETVEAAAGLVSTRTGVEANTDTVFQIGSITKLFTTALVMQLVEEGRIDLDAPVCDYLPELRLADLDLLQQVRVRHLLSHTSGIDGDYFEDTGRGDDAIERYVVACSALGFVHPPGERFSYCNAGFVIAGRIVEKLRGQPFHTVFRERLLKPLGMRSSGTLPEEAILHRAAVGHMPSREPDQPAEPVPIWMLVHSNAPAGSSPWATARDMLAFARMILGDGEAEGGRILEPGTIARMREHQIDTPQSFGGGPHSWCLGFMRFTWDGREVIGHDGGTIGQAAFFRVLPDSGLALALLTNGGDASSLYRDIVDRVFGEMEGFTLPPRPQPGTGVSIDPERYTGVYEKLSARLTVTAGEDNALVLRQEQRRMRIAPADPEPTTFRPIDESAFVAVEGPGAEAAQVICFQDHDGGAKARYLYAGTRCIPRAR